MTVWALRRPKTASTGTAACYIDVLTTRVQMQGVYKTMTSPVGELTLVATDRGLAAVLWENDNLARVRV